MKKKTNIIITYALVATILSTLTTSGIATGSQAIKVKAGTLDRRIEGDGEALVTDEGDVMVPEGSGDGPDVEVDPAEYYGFGYTGEEITGVLEKEEKVDKKESKDKKVKKGKKKKVVVKKGVVKKKEEQANKQEEAKKKVEQVKKEEQTKKAEQVRKAEEAKKKVEEAKRKTEEAKKKAEQAKKAEEAKKAEQAKKAEEAKKAEQAKKAEEAKKKAEQAKKKNDNKTGNKKYADENEAMRKSLLGVKGKVLARDDEYGAPLVIKQGDRLLLSDWQKKLDAHYGIVRDAKGWRLYSPDRGICPDHSAEGRYDPYCEYRQEEIDKMIKWEKEHRDE